MKKSIKQRYITSAFILLLSTLVIKAISAVYKIPLTSYIGATGRGYFSVAYNLCMPIHALTMGAFPLALTKLVSTYDARADYVRIKALRKASKKLFFIVGFTGLSVMLIFAKPYASIISSSPKSIYTIFALAPSVFFSCLAASHRAFAEGYLDMKPTAVSQIIEALFKTVFGLLFAKYSMSLLYGFYLESSTVLGMRMENEAEALAAIYPLTSACAMLGVTLGSIASWIYVSIYTKCRYNSYPPGKADTKSAFRELVAFSTPLVGATIIQSIANFTSSSSLQYCLSLCDSAMLLKQYPAAGDDVYTYAFGIYSAVSDFKSLIPSMAMALGVTAVPAVSSAYESGSQRFSSLLTSIFKYTIILAVGGGAFLALFSRDILSLFYSGGNSDIVDGGAKLLYLFGITSLPCAAASTSVFCVQSLGYSKQTIMPFAFSAVIRALINYLLVSNSEINILGGAVSDFF
ncbi:MAG: oligosaccharide flippase family protein, partial [Eubacterium sp.]